MAGISVPTASISASSSPAVACETNTTTVKVASCLSQLRHRRSHSKLSFSVSQKPKLHRFCSSKGTHPSFNRDVAVRAQLKKAAALDGSSNSASSPESRPEEAEYKVKNDNPSSESSSSVLASEESISEFISQVSSLVKLVDSRDIVELTLQQLDCEVVIRKKEAVTPTQAAPMVMMQAPPPTMVPQAVPPAPTPAAAPAPSPAPAGPPAAPAKSSLPPLKCPMAGTFYRSPAPGEPAFVKVGDKVQKGQVLCIIEAMKLMNEIEADQSGTIVEVIAEDGKPVSVDTPLFVIQP